MEGERTKDSGSSKDSKRRKKKNNKKKGRKSRFTRECSLMPEGGFFAKISGLAGNPSDSSSSSGSSDSDSSDLDSDDDNKGTHKLPETSQKQNISALKVKDPPTYYGVMNLDTYDHWVYNVTLWAKLHKLEDEFAVQMLGNFLAGKAGIFYMKYVVMKPKKWTLPTIFPALFDYCFPPDYKEELRTQLHDSRQGQKHFRDFAQDVEVLAERFPDVTKRQLVEIIWRGVVNYLQKEWSRAGLSREKTLLKELVKQGIRFETAERIS